MILLPRKDKEGNCYISYSQHSKWKSSKKEYIKQYFFGEEFEGNAYTEFGSRVGEALENNDFSSFNKVELRTLKKVTRLDEFEKEIRLDLGDFYVKGFIDTNDKDCDIIIDYKTGALNKVSEYEKDEYDQLAIYAAAIEQEMGKLPRQAHVELIERKGNPFQGEELCLGKEVIQIPKDISPKRILKVKKDVVKVATEISEYYRIYKDLNSITV